MKIDEFVRKLGDGCRLDIRIDLSTGREIFGFTIAGSRDVLRDNMDLLARELHMEVERQAEDNRFTHTKRVKNLKLGDGIVFTEEAFHSDEDETEEEIKPLWKNI